MKILALETSTDACSAALHIDGTLLQRFEIQARKHTELLLPMVESLLQEAALALTDLDAVAFSRGPGAFTGVRIATACAQGLAFSADLPVIPVSTLAAIAQRCSDVYSAPHIAACLDARMGEVYWGLFTRNEDALVTPASQERVISPETVSTADWTQWRGAGNGWQVYESVLQGRFAQPAQGIHADIYPSAASVARLAVAAAAQGQLLPAEAALPVYLRDHVAKKPRR